MSILGLIPARKGSKGIPGKNLAPLAGKPLIGWVCEQACRAEELDEVIISSDGAEIIEVAEKYGVRAPFVRPAELASDASKVVDTLAHALHWMEENEGKLFDYVCLIQPSAPMALAEDYDKASRLALEQEADTVISVYPCGQVHPAAMYEIDEENRIMSLAERMDVDPMLRRQDLPPVYMRSSIVYVVHRDTILQGRLYGDIIRAVKIPSERAQVDINTLEDLIIAECLLKREYDTK